MKKIIIACLVSIVCVFTLVCSSSAQEVMTVSGNDYTVFMLCWVMLGIIVINVSSSRIPFSFTVMERLK